MNNLQTLIADKLGIPVDERSRPDARQTITTAVMYISQFGWIPGVHFFAGKEPDLDTGRRCWQIIEGIKAVQANADRYRAQHRMHFAVVGGEEPLPTAQAEQQIRAMGGEYDPADVVVMVELYRSDDKALIGDGYRPRKYYGAFRHRIAMDEQGNWIRDTLPPTETKLSVALRRATKKALKEFPTLPLDALTPEQRLAGIERMLRDEMTPDLPPSKVTTALPANRDDPGDLYFGWDDEPAKPSTPTVPAQWQPRQPPALLVTERPAEVTAFWHPEPDRPVQPVSNPPAREADLSTLRSQAIDLAKTLYGKNRYLKAATPTLKLVSNGKASNFSQLSASEAQRLIDLWLDDMYPDR